MVKYYLTALIALGGQKNKEQSGKERQEAKRSQEPNLAFTINRGFKPQPIIKHVR